MRTPEQHLATLKLLASSARDEAVREAAAWAGEVVLRAREVREAGEERRRTRFETRATFTDTRALELERAFDQLLGRAEPQPRQLGLGLGGAP